MNRTGRLPRIHVSNTFHHVMIRGNNKQKIFTTTDCFNYFLLLVSESSDKFDHKIICYCLMSNHAHLLIYINNDSLSNIMQNINNRYAKWFNKKYNRIGHLFQGRYRSIAVNDDIYLINLCRYIHLNPVAAKITQNPSHYIWSSHSNYLSEKAPSWMEINLMLTTIRKKTSLSYHDFISQPVDRSTWKPGLYLDSSGKVIIEEEIARDLHSKLNQINNKNNEIKLSPDIVAKNVCNQLNINFSKLTDKSLDRETSEKRALLVHAWLNYSDISITEIANRLCRTRGTLSRQQARLCSSNNLSLLKQLNKIKKALDKEKTDLKEQG